MGLSKVGSAEFNAEQQARRAMAPRKRSKKPAKQPQPNTYQVDLGESYPDGCLWVNAYTLEHVKAWAKTLNLKDGWTVTRMRRLSDGSCRAAPDGVNAELDPKGRCTTPVVTVSGGCAEHFDGPYVSVIDFDNLYDAG